MASPKRNDGDGSNDSGKPAFTLIRGKKNIRPKRTYSKIARLQINRKYQQLERTNQLELPSRNARQTIEETRKPISKLIRMRRDPKNKNRVTRATLTSEGKLMRVLFRGSAKRWEDMDAQRKERYRRMVTETLVKQTQAVSRRKGNEKKTIRQVRENILPELERSQKRLEETIRINTGKVSTERIVELQNMRSVVEGIMAEMKAQTIPRERALVPVTKRPRERETIPFPGEAALRQRELRVSPELARTRPAPRDERRENREENERARREAEADAQLFDEIRARAADTTRKRKYPRSMKAIEDYGNGKISRDEALRIMAHETGTPEMLRRPAHNEEEKIIHLRKSIDIPVLGRIGPEKDPVYFTPTFRQGSAILPYAKYTAERKRERISKFMQKQPGASYVRGYSWYPRWVNAIQKARSIRRAAKVKTIEAWRAARKRRQK